MDLRLDEEVFKLLNVLRCGEFREFLFLRSIPSDHNGDSDLEIGNQSDFDSDQYRADWSANGTIDAVTD